MRELGGAVSVGGRVDVDIKLVPDRDEILREIPRLKEALNVIVELAAPSGVEFSRRRATAADAARFRDYGRCETGGCARAR